MKKMSSLTINTSGGQVKIKTVRQFLDNLPRKVFASHDDFYYETNVFTPSTSFAGAYTAEAIGDSEATYTRKTTQITLPKNFKEMKDNFVKFLLETKEIRISSSDFKEYGSTIYGNGIRTNLFYMLEAVEDTSVRLTLDMMPDPYVLIRIRPRTWCLISEGAWDMILPVRNFEDKLLGAMPVASKLGSWLIIEVERDKNVS